MATNGRWAVDNHKVVVLKDLLDLAADSDLEVVPSHDRCRKRKVIGGGCTPAD
jgi:hypothetical protein